MKTEQVLEQLKELAEHCDNMACESVIEAKYDESEMWTKRTKALCLAIKSLGKEV